jgi:hypothetical protein
MNNQPEALRLADLWEKHSHGYARTPESRTAAELRRLHQEHEEDQCVIAVWRGRTQQAEAQRDALLEALKEIANTDPVDAALDPQRAVRIARAAIRARNNT